MSRRDTQSITLPDGRTLGYAEYGSSTGTTLLYFHGFPSSRLEAYSLNAIASRLDIRILSLDRPGFGISSPFPDRKITDWPNDVQAFASQLDLKRFAILGASGGGPYALACAERLPSARLSAVGVLAGAPLWDRGVRTSDVPWYARVTYLLANYWPSGLRVLSSGLVGTVRWVLTLRPVERRIDGWLEAVMKAQAAKKEKEKNGDGDDDVVKGPLPAASTDTGEDVNHDEPPRSIAQRRDDLLAMLFSGFAQGSAEFVQETRLLTQPWGFKFEDIVYNKVQMWHGSKDKNAPVASLRMMAEKMNHCELKEYEKDHFGMGEKIEEVLTELMVKARRGDGDGS